jgi:hypothetical protein
VIKSNAITTLIQNDERNRSGKFTMPVFTDNIIKQLISSYDVLKK